MTEQEAKLKPCIGPAPQTTGELWNPGGDGVTRFGCAGSTCLAWRWHHDEPLCVTEGTTLHPEIINTVANAEEHSLKIIRHLVPTGHCGWIKP